MAVGGCGTFKCTEKLGAVDGVADAALINS